MDPQYARLRVKRALVAILAVAAVVGGLGIGMVAAGIGRRGLTDEQPVRRGRREPLRHAAPDADAHARRRAPTPTPEPTPTPSPTPVPTPPPVPAPLTGVLVPPDVAARHPIAVMVDDLGAARPQSGFNAASVVWQAPAEGGIPRYMMVFQENIPALVGPVRSSRYYYIAWAAEWRALYAHAGGSPQALRTLREKGNGQLVYNADEFRWAQVVLAGQRPPRAAQPVHGRRAPPQARDQRQGQGRGDGARLDVRAGPAGHLPPARRPDRGLVPVQPDLVQLRLAARTRYLRAVTGEKKQRDAADGGRVHPKNVVIMLMRFGPLNDGGEQAPPRGRRRRLGHGLDRDERDDDQGHLAEEGPHRADAVLRRERRPGDADGRPDVRPGHADGHRRSRSRRAARRRRPIPRRVTATP